ncbi:MAG: bifunctional oligoribonuclease/PAP phosphatase NrnA [Actinomycetota bacterium]
MDSEQLERAASVLRDAPTVALACHVNPDADALGSMLGLAHHLAARGAAVVCSFPNQPLVVPRWGEALPGLELLVEVTDFPAAPDVMVTCDCASFDRLGPLGDAATAARELIWIDHHRSNDGRGTIRLVDPAASSTCELAAGVIDAIGGDMTDASAVCLYAGLIADTGRFQYEAATPATLRLAARLREHPFDHARVSQLLYEDNRVSYLDVLSVAMSRAQLDAAADLVWTYILWSDFERADIGPGEVDDLIDVLRSTREADAAAVLKQQRDGRFKVSVRSRGAHDLSVIAATFGGGGHRLAAGYTSEHGPAATIADLRAALLGDPVAP